MLFNALFLIFGMFARICNSSNIESQNLVLYNETYAHNEPDTRNLGLKKLINKKNLIKVAKIAIKIGVAANPALSGVATGIRIAQKLLEARNKLKRLDALKNKAKSLKNIKSQITKVKAVISKDKKILASFKSKGKKLISKNKLIMSKGKDILSKGKNILSKGKNVLSKGKNILSKGKDILSKVKNIISKIKKTSTISKSENAPISKYKTEPGSETDTRSPTGSQINDNTKRSPKRKHTPPLTNTDDMQTRQKRKSLAPTQTITNTDDKQPKQKHIIKTITPTLTDTPKRQSRAPMPIPTKQIRTTQTLEPTNELSSSPTTKQRQTHRPKKTQKPKRTRISVKKIIKQPFKPKTTNWPSNEPTRSPIQKKTQSPSFTLTKTPTLLPTSKLTFTPTTTRPTTTRPTTTRPTTTRPTTTRPTTIPTPLPTPSYIPCNKNCPIIPVQCGFYQTCGLGCWCGIFPPTPSSLPTRVPTFNLFTISSPTMIPYSGSIIELHPSARPTHVPTLKLPSLGPTSSPSLFILQTKSPSLAPTPVPTPIPTNTQLLSQLPTTSTITPPPTQSNKVLESTSKSDSPTNSSNMIVTGSVIGFIFLLVIVAAVIFCLTRKNKNPSLDAFTKWSRHYDNKQQKPNNDPFSIEENDIHHFYNKNTIGPRYQRNSLKPQQHQLPMIEYNTRTIV